MLNSEDVQHQFTVVWWRGVEPEPFSLEKTYPSSAESVKEARKVLPDIMETVIEKHGDNLRWVDLERKVQGEWKLVEYFHPPRPRSYRTFE